MTRAVSFRTLFFVIPSQSEESTAWMLRCAQHDKTEDVIPSQSEESTHGCFAALSMTMEESVDASLRYAPFSMTE